MCGWRSCEQISRLPEISSHLKDDIHPYSEPFFFCPGLIPNAGKPIAGEQQKSIGAGRTCRGIARRSLSASGEELVEVPHTEGNKPQR